MTLKIGNLCTADAIEKIPPEYQEKKFVESKWKQVPTGGFKCVTNSDTSSKVDKKGIHKQNTSTTNCNPVYEKKLVSEEVTLTVDIKLETRRSYILACTRDKCREKYGNKDCDTGH